MVFDEDAIDMAVDAGFDDNDITEFSDSGRFAQYNVFEILEKQTGEVVEESDYDVSALNYDEAIEVLRRAEYLHDGHGG
jgi:hypothetical protein